MEAPNIEGAMVFQQVASSDNTPVHGVNARAQAVIDSAATDVPATTAASEELFLSSTACAAGADNGGGAEEREFGSDGGLWPTAGARSSKTDSTAAPDIETSRRMFLTRLSLEDTANNLEKLETIVGVFLSALEGHQSDSATDSRAQSTTVDPFKLSKRPLEDVAEDICSRIQTLTERLESRPEIREVMLSSRSQHNAYQKETSALPEPFQGLSHPRTATHHSETCSRHSSMSVDTGANAGSETEPVPSEASRFHSTFGPLVDTYHLESTGGFSPHTQQQSTDDSASRFTGTFGPMLDTLSSLCLNRTLSGTALGDGTGGRGGRTGEDSAAFNVSSGVFTKVTGILRPATNDARARPLAPQRAQEDSLFSASMQVDLQQSNPPQWLMRVPGPMPGLPSTNLAGQSNQMVSPRWKYVDPMSGTPVSFSTFGEHVLSERSCGFERHHVGTQTTPPPASYVD